jgi:hypothetical protein
MKGRPDVELVTIAERRSLIAVNREVVKSLPGINIIPLSGNRAFLALDPKHGMADLELAVIDRLENPSDDLNERKALMKFRTQLRAWRHDRTLQFHTRAIIVVEQTERDDRVRGAVASQQTQPSLKTRGRSASQEGPDIPQPATGRSRRASGALRGGHQADTSPQVGIGLTNPTSDNISISQPAGNAMHQVRRPLSQSASLAT